MRRILPDDSDLAKGLVTTSVEEHKELRIEFGQPQRPGIDTPGPIGVKHV